MNRNSQAGFSLIEVVLTFSILAVATTALGLVELSNSQRTQDLKRLLRALLAFVHRGLPQDV